MWKSVRYQLTSSCQMIVHNGQTASPLNKFSRSLKLISSKRKKVDADYEEMAHIEFLAGLYMGPDGPVLPSHMLDAAIINGAKKSKEGQIAKSSVFCDGNAQLVYDGPKNADELWADERFRFSAIVRIGTARVERMRPTFDKWAAIIMVQYDNEVVNIGRIDDWVSIAGTQVGLGDWRPKYGRFTAQRLPG